MGSLTEATLPVQLGGGVDTKTDDKQVLSTKLSVLENGVFDVLKKIKKRFGYVSLGNTTDSITLTASQALGVLFNRLIQFANFKSFIYSPKLGVFHTGGSAYPVTCNNQVVSSGLGQVQIPDMGIVSGYQVIAYRSINDLSSDDAQFICTVNELSTGTNFILNQQVNASLATGAGICKVVGPASVFTPGEALILMSQHPSTGTKKIFFTRWNAATPSTLIQSGTPIVTNCGNTTVAGYPDNNHYFDAVHLTGINNTVLAYLDPVANTINVVLIDQNANIVTRTSVPSNGATNNHLNSICVTYDLANGQIYVFFCVDYNLSFAIFNTNLVTVVNTTLIDNNATTLYDGNLTAFVQSPGSVLLVADRGVTPDTSTDRATDHSVVIYTVTPASTFPVAPTNLCEGAVLASQMFKINGKIYVTVAVDLIDQAVYWLIECAYVPASPNYFFNLAARFLYGNAGGWTQTAVLPQVSINGQEALIPLLVRTILSPDGSGSFRNSVSLETLNFGDTDHSFISSIFGESLFISGAEPLLFDGALVAEQGYNAPPKILTAYDNGAGALSAGIYTYYAVYEWRDALGNVHRSAPSNPVQVTLAASHQVAIELNTLFVSSKGNSSKDPTVLISIYRTQANGETAYKVNNLSIPYDNYLTSNSGFFDNVSDADLVNHEILYTAGGVLANDPAPSCSFCWPYKLRLMLGGLDNPYQIAFSKIRTAGEGVAFPLEFLIDFDPSGGVLTAGGQLDDKCIVFTANKIYFFYGDGPDDTGQNNDFTTPQQIISPVGCPYPKSLILTPSGLIFKSNKGFWLLNRALALEYIGADVESYNSASVTSAVLLEETNQIRFTLNSGVILMYDYFVGQWSVFTGINAVSAVNWQGSYSWARSDGTVFQEGTNFDDAGTAISLKIGTSWLKMSGLQGYHRTKRLYILGDYKSSHQLTVQVYYDYETTIGETHTINPDSILGVNGNDTVYQFRLALKRQKCEAIKIVLFDSFTGMPAEGYNLSSLELKVQMKRGMWKPSPEKAVG